MASVSSKPRAVNQMLQAVQVKLEPGSQANEFGNTSPGCHSCYEAVQQDQWVDITSSDVCFCEVKLERGAYDFHSILSGDNSGCETLLQNEKADVKLSRDNVNQQALATEGKIVFMDHSCLGAIG